MAACDVMEWLYIATRKQMLNGAEDHRVVMPAKAGTICEFCVKHEAGLAGTRGNKNKILRFASLDKCLRWIPTFVGMTLV